MGNGYSTNSFEHALSRNGYAHTHVSAGIVVNSFPFVAETLGNMKEGTSSTPFIIDSPDEYKDQYNNELGRRIGSWLKSWIANEAMQGREYTQAEKDKMLDDLIRDADISGNMIKDERVDSKTKDFLQPYDPAYQTPKDDVTWNAPSNNWQGRSVGRDYSLTDDFSENPIGFVLDLPEHLADAADALANKLFDSLDDLLNALVGAIVPAVIDSLIPSWLQSLLGLWGDAQAANTPLVLDLDANGIDLASVTGSGAVYWDIDVDGYDEASGWIAGNDGLLAIDLNSDGLINNHSELFGTELADGFTVLSAYDSNLDNLIDATDTQFADLLVWVDANSNGYSESAELFSLSDLGITSINLNNSLVDYDIAGNHITHESTFTINGQTQTIVDAWFAYDNTNSVYREDYTPIALALKLPTLRGFGDVKDLHIAMSMDETLLGMVQDIAVEASALLFGSAFGIQGKIEDLMYRWAGVDGVDPASRGGSFDARKLEFLEKYTGSDYLQGGINSDPGSGAASALEITFNRIYSHVLTGILVQSGGSDFLETGLSYNFTTGEIEGGTQTDHLWELESNTNSQATDFNDVYVVQSGMGQVTAFLEDLNGGTDQVWINATADNVGMWVDSQQDLHIQLIGTADEVEFLANDNSGTDIVSRLEKIIFSDGASLDLTQGLMLTDTDDGHFSVGSALNDSLDGRGGSDSIFGYSGDDTLTGGAGTDYLYGGIGNDKYFYDAGFGYDYITEESGNDTILFGTGITQSDLTFSRVGYHLIIDLPNSDAIRIDNYYSGNSDYIVEELRFDDDSVVDLQVLLNTAPVATNDAFIGDQDTNITGNLLVDNGNGADSDAENNTLSVVAGTYSTTNGSVTITSNGDFTYTPSSSYNGSDSFTYTLEDNFTGSDTATVNLTVRPPNVAPVAQDDVFSGDQDINITGNLLSNNGNGVDSDPDGDPLSVVSGTYSTTHGSVTVSSNGSFTYTPDSEYFGSDSFNYTLQDDRSGSDTGTVSITLNEMISGSNAINGTAAVDYLYGDQSGVSDDVITGFASNDQIYGYLGNDSYVWAVGDGNDTLTESGGSDQLILHSVLASEIRFENLYGYNLNVHIGSETITLNNQFASDYYASSSYDQNQIEKIVLDDTTEISLLGGLTFNGTSGVDYLYSLKAGSTLVGEEGNDNLTGYSGDDSYVWAVGDGNDTLTENGGSDQLILHDVTASEIRFENLYGYNLKVHIGSETITLNNQFASDYYASSSYDQNQIEKIVLDDTTEIDILNNLTFTGTSGTDYMYGLHAADTLRGEGGSDYLYGGDGDDALYGGAGVDMLYGQGGADTFIFEAVSAFTNSDNIQDFDLSAGDKLDISDLLEGYDPITDAITDFVQITESGGNSYLNVDANGGADNFVQVAYIYNETGLTDEAALETSGNLIAA